MTKPEFAMIAVAVKSAYPASKIMADDASMEFWYRMLKDLNGKVVENAVMEHISTSVYPPNIAEIRKLCMERCKPPVLSFDEAWGVVQRAMSEYGWYHPQEAFALMDDLTVSVVKNLGWSRLCQSENPTADRANFREAYEAKAKEAVNSNMLPDFIANEKLMLQQRYVPQIEAREPPAIEQTVAPERKELTPQQCEERARQFEAVRRRLMGGGTNE